MQPQDPKSTLLRKEVHEIQRSTSEGREPRWQSNSEGQELLEISGRSKKSEHAVATHICDDSWAHGALALGASLQKFHPHAEIVAMISPAVNPDYRRLLGSVFDRVYKVHPVIQEQDQPADTPFQNCATLQVRAWSLPYQKVLYMEPDMIALANPDSMLENLGELSAKTMGWLGQWDGWDRGNGWDNGMFVIHPSKATFTKLARYLNEIHQRTPRVGQLHRSHVQQALNYMFPQCTWQEDLSRAGCWLGNISSIHNKLNTELSLDDVNSLLGDKNTDHESLQFLSGKASATDKPWMASCLASNATIGGNGTVQNQALGLWCREFRRIQPVDGLEHLLDMKCPACTGCGHTKSKIDYVMFVKDLHHCVTRASLTRLAKFAHPRRIVVIAPGEVCKSADYGKLADLVSKRHTKLHCVAEDRILPEISQQSVESWLHSRFGEQEFSSAGSESFLVDNSELRAASKGLGYHHKKRQVEPGFDNLAHWGSIIQASDENDGWVRTIEADSSFLPKTWDGSVVLRRLSREQLMQVRAGRHINQSLAESFHQQFLKLATAEVAQRLELTDNFVIWDADMLLLRDFCPMNAQGQINFMKDSAPEHRSQCQPQHESSFHQLTGLDSAGSLTGKQVFSTHHMVVNTKEMIGLLDAIRDRSRNSNSHWSTAILEMACPSLRECACGISDSGFYASWMKQKLPEMVAEVEQQETKVTLPRPDMCCPYEYSFTEENKKGLLAGQFPKDNAGSCKASEPSTGQQ